MRKGFTLIELLITIAIFTLLITIAYPSYQMYLIKARRHDARIALLDLAVRMEQYYAQHQTYQGARLTNTKSPQGFYQLSMKVTKKGYELMADPIKTQKNDESCQQFTLNNLGVKGTSGLSDVTSCW